MMPMSSQEEDLSLRTLAVSPDREFIAWLREALFALGGVELLSAVPSVDTLRLRPPGAQPDLVLVDADRYEGQMGDHLQSLRKTLGSAAVVAVTCRPEMLPPWALHLASPPSLEGLKSVLAQVRTDLSGPVGPDPRVDAGGAEPQGPYLRRLLVRSPGHLRVLPVTEIEWVDAVHNAVKLHTAHGPYRLRQSIAALAAGLDPAQFQRIHRSTIVRLGAVLEYRVDKRGRYHAVLPGGTVLTISRSYHEGLMDRLRST